MFDLTKPWPFGVSRRTWPYVAAGLAVIVAGLALIDIWASRGAIGWPEQWRAPFQVITNYGLSDWVLAPSLLLFILARIAMLFLRKLPRIAAFEVALLSGFIFCGVAIPGLLANFFKRIIGRARPDEFHEVGAFSFQNLFNDWTYQSFPSGHSTIAIALAFTIGFLLPRVFPLFFTIGVVVAFSRIPVGMHYPSDVFGGFILGTFGAYGVRNLFASRRWLFARQIDGRITRRSLPGLTRLFQRARA